MLEPTSADRTLRTSLYERYAALHYGLRSEQSEAVGFRRDVLPYLPQSHHARILDIGCGQGDIVAALQGRGYADVSGVDVSHEQVRIAHQKGVDRIEQADLLSHLESAEVGSVDCVLAVDVLEHLSRGELLEALTLICRALRSDGILLARVPNSTSPFGGNYVDGDFTHQVALTPRSFRQVALLAGFAQVDAFSCAPVGHGFVSWLRVALWRVFAGGMRLALAVETGRTDHIVTQAFVALARKGS